MNAIAPRFPWGLADRLKVAGLTIMFGLVMGAPWVGGFFADVSFSIDAEGKLTEGPARAFPGCEGFGCDTKGGRGGYVCIVTNTNSTGVGSFTNCLMDTEPRIIIFKVSGVIATATEINPALAQSKVTVLGQTAPGDGIMLKPAGVERIFRLGQGDTPSNAISDVVFQHIRMRLVPGNPGVGHDAFLIAAGSHHIVFDHCEILWTSDEGFNLFTTVTAAGSDIHHITFSRCIIGEGGLTQNKAALHTGPRIHSITYHHNLWIHTDGRTPKHAFSDGTNNVNRGVQFINNVSTGRFQIEHSQPIILNAIATI